ncbi:MAG: NOT2 family [Lasallia pustulata]|uniref:NOT2 family n=1 Tax=Lasallia pustulata TaxID=136370 RepID=A0A5M8PS40_9LECA|nr:MAG: NOT2 family [Lasallia pustulata]
MNRPGPGPQPLRGIPGFPGQQAPQSRAAPLGSGRLQNGKIGNGPSWGYGMPVNGAPRLPNPQARPTSAATTSFAQTIGGSQPATPLDLSEFPSLSGAPRPQYQNPSQAVWANANQRATQHTPVQRPQQQQPADLQISAQQQQQPPQQQQEHAQQNAEDIFSSRNENGDVGQDRRGSLMQSAAFGSYTNGHAFAPQSNQQNRQGVSAGQQDSGRSSTLVDRILSPSSIGSAAMSAARSTAESMRQGQGVLSEQDLNNGNNSLFSGLQDSQITLKPGSFTEHQQQRLPSQSQPTSSRLQQQQSGFGGDLVDSPGTAQTPDHLPLSEMSELDRFGLAGLLAMSKNDNQDLTSLANGQDLTQLGLDLNSSDPLYPTFASPFAESGSRPMQPEFALPQCYTVHNVHKLDTKVPSFSDETLFYMFYTMPRDVMQEVAAGELTNRNWRYHKDLKVWLTKDVNYGDPTPISPGAERGSYIFFNPSTWQRTRQEFILRYDALDNHIPVRSNGIAMA